MIENAISIAIFSFIKDTILVYIFTKVGGNSLEGGKEYILTPVGAKRSRKINGLRQKNIHESVIDF